MNEMRILKPNGKRAKNAILSIKIVLGLEIVSFISNYLQYDFLRDFEMGKFITNEAAYINDVREQVVSIVYLIAFIVSGIMFIKWFRRAYYNLSLKSGYLTFKDNWALWSWFVPIISFYRPYKIMKELYNGARYFLEDNRISFNQNFTTKYLGWWWGLWLISGILGHVLFRMYLKANTLSDFYFVTIGGMIDNIIKIPLALITIKIIRDYANIEPLLHQMKEQE